jgi:hypothetical protein
MGDQYLNYLLIIFIDLVNFPDVDVIKHFQEIAEWHVKI